jgi:hypothetical protein
MLLLLLLAAAAATEFVLSVSIAPPTALTTRPIEPSAAAAAPPIRLRFLLFLPPHTSPRMRLPAFPPPRSLLHLHFFLLHPPIPQR